MSKSRVRKKNGKKVKYTPPPKGISKTQMKKIQEYFKMQKEMGEIQKIEEAEIGEKEQSELPEFSEHQYEVAQEESSESPEEKQD